MAMSSVVSRSLPVHGSAVAAQRKPSSARMPVVGVRSWQGEGFMTDGFKQALQQALDRDNTALDSSGGYSRWSDSYRSDSSYGGGGGGRGGSSGAYERSLTAAAGADKTPLLQVLATALSQSRATLDRLVTEEAEIEALIQRERKQVERLEWLLQKVQQDYAFFDQLQQRFDEGRTSTSDSYRSDSSYGRGGRWS